MGEGGDSFIFMLGAGGGNGVINHISENRRKVRVGERRLGGKHEGGRGAGGEKGKEDMMMIIIREMEGEWRKQGEGVEEGSEAEVNNIFIGFDVGRARERKVGVKSN